METVDNSAVDRGLEAAGRAADPPAQTTEVPAPRRDSSLVMRRGQFVRIALASADAIGLIVSFFVAELVYGSGNGPFNTSTEFLLFVATVPGWLFVAKLYGLYDRDEQRTDHTTPDDIVDVVHMVTMGTWLFFAVSWLVHFAAPELAKVFAFWVLAVVLLPLGRAAARAICRRSPGYVQNALIYGAGPIGRDVARKFLRHPEYGVNLVGFVDSSSKESHPSDICPILGASANLREIVERFDIDRVVVAAPADSPQRASEHIRSVAELPVHIDIVPTLQDFVSPRVQLHGVEGVPLIGLPRFALSRTQRDLKRAMDVLLSAIGLLVLAPLFAVLGILIKLDSPGPVFFRQLRMGAGERPFLMLKFRTMAEDADAHKAEFAHLNRHAAPGGDPRMFKIPDDPRTTRIGKFIRRYSLDELPQLFNVLRDEMTLVGPRPLILDEDQHVAGWARKRVELKPGMTGLWQVLGRNEIPFNEMVKLDYLYVTSWSLWRDCLLLLRTIPLVLRGTRVTY